ncbi:hypothetical protein M2265_004262 [Sphingobacterium kitahiroshimense]|nr:hypothetical protein [Sphingobacterium kitahiroshimense]
MLGYSYDMLDEFFSLNIMMRPTNNFVSSFIQR